MYVGHDVNDYWFSPSFTHRAWAEIFSPWFYLFTFGSKIHILANQKVVAATNANRREEASGVGLFL